MLACFLAAVKSVDEIGPDKADGLCRRCCGARNGLKALGLLNLPCRYADEQLSEGLDSANVVEKRGCVVTNIC